VAVDSEHAATLAEVIGESGLDCQTVRNRAALMVLPAGVTKGTGLGAVLTEMNLSPHNTVAVGMRRTTCRCSGWLRSASLWPMPSLPCDDAPISSSRNRTELVSPVC